jgi:hypothetical protein
MQNDLFPAKPKTAKAPKPKRKFAGFVKKGRRFALSASQAKKQEAVRRKVLF